MMKEENSSSEISSNVLRSRKGATENTIEVNNFEEDPRKKNGLSVNLASYFMIAQMAGAGFLALPRAFADAGWIGIVLMFLFCVSVGFSASRLANCWVMLEKRYEEYRMPVRQPYQEMAFRAIGIVGRRVSLTLICITQIGSATVYIILISELLNSILPVLSLCEWALVVAAIIIPFAWLGSPKDFWQASVFAVISTLLSIVIIIVKIFLDYQRVDTYPPPDHPNPTVSSFSLGFGAILFAFGGSPVFPTIQNDMQDRSQFWKSILVSFITILCLYFPVAFFGYLYIGDAVNSNIFLSLEQSPVLKVAIVCEIFNLLASFIITISPVFQGLEDVFNVPHTFGWKRLSLRTGIILGELLIALSFPDFGLVLNLIGGSSMCCLTFILPPLMYMKLMDNKDHQDDLRSIIPLWQRCYLYEMIFIGVVGGISATVSALIALLSPDSFAASCFADFKQNSDL